MSVIENPTYLEHIRYYFEEQDHVCMFKRGIDLSTLDSLKERANSIYFQTRPPEAKMPPQVERQWSEERSETFLNWIKNDFPRGKPTVKSPSVGSVLRVRKDADSLTDEEIEKLKKAFKGIMDLPSSDKNSYFYIAGLHWFPEPSRCEHHTPLYNPWHRAYLELFEAALRTIEGCEDVTLPYWDITKKPPTFLFDAPFASYTLPEKIHRDFEKGFTTQRYIADDIYDNVINFAIPNTIIRAVSSDSWEGFSAYIEQAHDSGHPACGPSLATADVAAFDPLFWFFHCNWDRLWWRWQQRIGGTTYWNFRSTITSRADFLEAPLNRLAGLTMTSDETISIHELGATYTIEDTATETAFESAFLGNSLASEKSRTSSSNHLSVRVKGIERLEIPGTFFVSLKSDGKLIGKKAFFQSFSPKECATCRKGAVVNIDFIADASSIINRELTVQIDVINRNGGLSPFPVSSAGNPTINARVLMKQL